MKRTVKKRAPAAALYAALILLLAIMLLPYLFMLLSSFKENFEIFTLRPSLLPRDGFRLTRYSLLFRDWPVGRNLLNSLVVSASVTLSMGFFSSLAGYAFAKFDFPGRGWLFKTVLITMMIPACNGLIAGFVIIRALKWINTYQALIVPGSITAYGIFLISQFARESIPGELLESARMDGAREFHTFLAIGLPLMLPAVASLCLLSFLNTWNEFLWPMIVINSKRMFTVTLTLKALADPSLAADYGIILAGATVASLPVIALYALFNRQLVKGFMEGGLKG